MHAHTRNVASPLSLNALPPPAVVSWLGFAGLIPFAAPLLLGLFEPTLTPRLLHAQQLYGAVILSFLGAIHWGLAMVMPEIDSGRQHALFIWSVVPSLIGWLACLLGGMEGSLLLSLGLLVQYACDVYQMRCGGVPAWYLRLRIRLTTLAVLSLLAGVWLLA